MMGVVMLLMFMPPGMWVPSLPNILEANGVGWVLPFATALAPAGAVFSTLLFGAMSDQRVNAERLLGYLGLGGAGFLWLGFSSLEWGWHPGWYLFFQGCNAVLSGPMFSLLTKVKLSHLENAERSFPIYSMFGTIGWMSGGWLVSGLGLDASAQAGQIGAFIRVCMALLCFTMPATPPTNRDSRGWRARLGLTAFGLLKDRELRVFYVASFLFAIPVVSFYMVGPLMLKDLGSLHPSAELTLGQVVELGAMLFLSAVAGRLRIRWFVIVGMSLRVAALLLFCAIRGVGAAGSGVAGYRAAWADLHIYDGGGASVPRKACAGFDAWAGAGAVSVYVDECGGHRRRVFLRLALSCAGDGCGGELGRVLAGAGRVDAGAARLLLCGGDR